MFTNAYYFEDENESYIILSHCQTGQQDNGSNINKVFIDLTVTESTLEYKFEIKITSRFQRRNNIRKMKIYQTTFFIIQPQFNKNYLAIIVLAEA